MADQQRIVLAGSGDQEVYNIYFLPRDISNFSQPGIPAGDVIFVLRAAPHDSFERSGNDLLTIVTITLSEALLGFSRILITHLDGRGIKVSSPDKPIKPGSSIVLRAEGMPVFKHPDQKGDLYIRFEIEMPDEQWLKTVDAKVCHLSTVRST
jgi:DnaJ family protein A protein 2